jgi:D-methionine transport system permease protein
MVNGTWSSYMVEIILPALLVTLKMMIFATALSVLFGFLIAVALVLTDKNGMCPIRPVYVVLDFLVNLIRSFPFMILIVVIFPFTRLLIGTSIGWQAAVVPLTIAMSPFIARVIENSLKEVNPQLIEASRSLGASRWQTIWHVMLVEAVPSIISGITLAIITALGATAMAGAVGAGGLGAVALTYGYQSFNDTIMYLTVAVLVVVVQLIQIFGNYIYKKMK